VLGAVDVPQSVHQAKFSMGTVLALITVFHRAGLREFEDHYADPRVAAFCGKVTMVSDPEIDGAYPGRWIGKVTVETTNGRVLHGRIEEPRGDPGNPLTRAEIEEKALRLADFSGAATPREMQSVFAKVRELTRTPHVGFLLP
jgi:2-methylcitrate dehydratase PrpD